MNRRNFFKTVAGFIAGVCAACVPKTKAKLRDYDAHLVLGDDFDEVDLFDSEEAPWDKLGCKDCFRECGQWDICMATLRKRVKENDAKKEAKRYVKATVEYNKQFWRFYINGKEVDSKRAVDELETLHFPFRGAKKRDVCTMKSPKIFI